jgi:PAS domain S-box-containing protein
MAIPASLLWITFLCFALAAAIQALSKKEQILFTVRNLAPLMVCAVGLIGALYARSVFYAQDAKKMTEESRAEALSMQKQLSLALTSRFNSLNHMAHRLSLSQKINAKAWSEDARFYLKDTEKTLSSGLTALPSAAYLFGIVISYLFTILGELFLRLRDQSKVLKSRFNEKAQKLAAIVESSDDAIISKDLNAMITSWNQGAEAIFGYRSSEIIGKSILLLIPPDRTSEESRIMDQILSGETISHYETERVCKDGKRIFISLSISPLKDLNGRIVGLAKIARDITAAKSASHEKEQALTQLWSAEAQVLQANEQLEERVRQRSIELERAKEVAVAATGAKSDFLANMSHEIRTPINGVIGMTSLLLDTKLDEEQKGFVRAISSSSKILLTLINDILDLSKVEAGKMELEKHPFEMSEMLREVCENFEPLIRAKSLNFRAAFEFDAAVVVMGDLGRIHQILNNLLSNALKFTQTGEIKLRAVQMPAPAGRVLIGFTVSDTGIGISEPVINQLFQKFTQADPSTSRKYGGTGLGLVISKRLAELMGGTIRVESSVGKGSSFFFDLEFELSALLIDRAESVTSSAMLTKDERRKKRILVAEDIAVNQTITLRMLAKAGYSADAVANGLEVLDAVDRIPYDLILMDCQMPEMDGFRATELLRHGKFEKPIVALTANAFAEDKKRCLSFGMSGHIAKPIDEKSLIRTVDKWCLAKTGAPEPSNESETPVSGPPLIDLHAIQRLRALDEAGGEKISDQVIGMFLETSRELLVNLKDALTKNDRPAFTRAAHALRSCGGNVGAHRVVSICETFEHAESLDGLTSQLGELDRILAATAESLSSLKSQPSKEKLRILIVDDIEDNRFILKHYLKGLGHEVAYAIDGRPAVELFQKQTFDIVFIDMQMNEMDGDEATRRMREIEVTLGRARTPIVAVTSSEGPEEVDRMLAAGCNRHLSKPLTKEAFLQEVVRPPAALSFKASPRC